MRVPRPTLLASICMLCVASFASAMSVAAAPVPEKIIVGVALPRAQLGQGNDGSADVAEPLRQALMAYLKGPALEVVPLEARIPQQIDAEARQRGCAFVLYTDVTQTAKKGGFGLLKKLAPVANALPMLGGGGGLGNVGTQVALQAATQAAMQSQMQEAQENAMANAMAAINGAQKSNVKAGDSLTLAYKLVKLGVETPFKADTILGKAKANGEDVLSPLIENVAIAVVGAATGG
jgi:hypothetical protein